MIEPLNPDAEGYFFFNEVQLLDKPNAEEILHQLVTLDENEVVELVWRNATLKVRAGTALAMWVQGTEDAS